MPFGTFFENLAKNTAMFAAFAGMEKYLTGPIAKTLGSKVAPNTRVLQVAVKG